MRETGPRAVRRVGSLLAAASAAILLARGPAAAQQDPFSLRPEFVSQAVFSCGDVQMNGGSTVTTAGTAADGHVVANGNVTLNGSSTIRGDATAGPGKKITTTGLSRVIGTKGNLVAPWPCSPVDLAALATALAAANDNALVPKTDKNRNPLTGSAPPTLHLYGGETLVLPAGTYFLKDLTLDGASAIAVSGEVRILATGNVTLNGSSTVNLTGNAASLRIFVSGSAVALHGGSRMKSFLYASAATATVTLDGGSTTAGGVYGGRLTLNGASTVKRDLVATPPASPIEIAITESGQPLVEGAVFNRVVTPLISTTGGTPAVTVTATLDGSPWVSGSPVSAEGDHTLVASASDSSTPPQSKTSTRHFRIDRQGPVLSVSAPPLGALVSTPSVVVAGLAGDAIALTINGAPVPLGAGGAFSATVPLAEGTNSVSLVARDAAGNPSTLTHPIVLDSLPPVLTLSSPVSGSCLAAGASLVVAGRVADAHPRLPGAPDGPSVSLTLTPPAGAPTTLMPTPDASGAFSSPLPLAEGNDGVATLLVTAADALGNVARSLLTLRVDGKDPEVSITVDGSALPGSGPGTAPPSGTVPILLNRPVSPRALVADGSAAAPPATLTLNGQPYVAGTTISAEGTYLLVATARDCAGREGSAWASFAIDTTPPVLELTIPADGALLKDPVTTFSGTASTDLHLARVAGREALVEPGQASSTFALAGFPWKEGENVVVVELVDRAGNEARFTRRFTVKTTGPVVEILVGGVPIGTARTFFEAVAPEVRTNEPLSGPGAATLSVMLDGISWTPGTSIGAPGPHELVAKVTDAAGRDAEARASFTIDATPGPSIAIASPLDGATIPGPTVDVAGTVSAPHSAGATAVRVNGRPAQVSGTGWSLPGLPVTQGEPTDLVAVATDALGRTASSSVQVLVRSDGPKVVVLSPADGSRTNRRRIDVTGAVVGGAGATVDGLVRAGGLTAAIDATGGFRLRDVPLAYGANAISVSALDAQGRTGSATVTVHADTTPPSVAFAVGGQTLIDGARFSGPVTVDVSLTDDGGAAPAPRIALNGASVEAAWPATEVPVPGAGGWVVSVVAADAAGNETRASRSFVVDDGGCELSTIRPVDGSATSESKVTLVGRSGGATRVLVRVPQPGGSPQEYVASLADGTFAAGDVPLPAMGENALAVVCEAPSGSTASTPLRIQRLSGDGPTVSIAAPAAGALVPGPSAVLSGAVSDATVDLYVNGAKVGAGSRSGSSFTLAGVALTEGPNVLVARAVDRGGRAGEARVVVSRDSQAPRVSLVWPTSGARFGKRGDAAPAVDVTGSVELASEPNLLSVVASTLAGAVTAVVDPITGAFRAEGLALGAPGTQQVKVVATDAVGRSTTVEVDVLVEADGPALRLDAPADLIRLTAASASSIALTGEAWAAEGATVSVNGVALDPATLAWEPAAVDGRRHVAFATSVAAPAQDGPFGLIVRVEDLQGRSASTRRLVVRDTVAPSVVEGIPASGATGVDHNGVVLVLFSEEVTRASLAAANGFALTRDGQPEPIVGTFFAAGSAIAFVPGAALTPGSTYRLSIGSGVVDVAGNPVGSAYASTFTVAPALLGTAPAFDPAPPSVVCSSALELRGSAPAGAMLRATDGDVSVTAVADSAGRFVLSIPFVGNGYHDVSVRVVGRDGTSSPAVHALVRKDCSAPLVERAELDRTSGRLKVRFSERMDPTKLVLSTTAGDGGSVLLSLEGDPAAAPHAGTVSLQPDGRELFIDLPSAADAWWRDEAVRLTVRPPAADERGNPLSAPWVTTFFPGAGPGDLSGGFLSGETYDDATGRPLDGVEARLYSSSSSLPGAVATPDAPTAMATTDVRGRYGFFGDAVAGRYVLHLAKAGYAPVVRRLPLAPGSGVVPFDGRLAPHAPPSAARLSLSSGGSFEGPDGLLLELAPNALVPAPEGTLGIRLTPLSAQSLPELLPLGWSPLAAADVRLETEGTSPTALPQSNRFASDAAHVTLPLPEATPAGAALVAVRHDLASGRWLTLGPVDRRAGPGGSDVARIALVSPGAVAIVLADTDADIAPPALASGPEQPLTAASAPSTFPQLSATLVLTPPIVGPSGRSTARVVARSADGAAKWPSGTAVQAYLDEKLVLSGGGELYEAPFAVDLLLAHHPVSAEELGGAAPGTAGALSFAVSPSPKAAQVVLESGWENVRLYPFPESLERGSILGGLGGTVASADGVELTLPEGALAESVAVEAKLISGAELSALVPPAGYDLLAAVRVSLSGRTLARAATLSVPLPTATPQDPPAEARLLLAQLVPQPADGRGAFARVTARASWTAGPRAVAAPEAADSALPLEGLVEEGTYLLLRAQAPLGFATGFVRIGNGNGLALSRVAAPTLGTADLSRPGGRYAIPVSAGADRDVVAAHPQLDEKATARIAVLSPSAVVALDLLVHPVGPSVARVEPPDGAATQSILSPLVVHFSEPIDPASVVPGLLVAELLAENGAPTGAVFRGTTVLQPGGASLVFAPSHPLPAGKRIRGVLTAGVRDAGGTPYEGPLPYAWSFTTTAQVSTGGLIDLAKIRLLLPENGTARIVGAAGAIPSGWSVSSSVENARPSPVCPETWTNVDSTGAFSILAGCGSTPVTLSSRVFLKVVDTGNNSTVLPLGPYVSADGLAFVPQPGETTVYKTPEGVEVTVPAGAFDEAKVVRVAKKDPATLGVALPPFLEVGAFVDVDFDGEANETLRLRVPVTTTAPVGTLVFAGTPLDLPWGRRLRLIDLARIVDGGGGAKVISNAESDQPSLAAQGATSGSGGVRALELPRVLLRTTLLEMTHRALAAFFYGQGVQMSAVIGSVLPAQFGSAQAVLYNGTADSCVYVPMPHDWDGRFVLPSVTGSALDVVVREVATGWILGRSAYDPATGGANGVRDLGQLPPPAASDPPAAPKLIDSSPFHLIRFRALDAKAERRCEALTLELQSCTQFGIVAIATTPGNRLPEGSSVEVSLRRWDEEGRESGTSSHAVVNEQGALSGELLLPAKPEDELTLVVTPGDLDPENLVEFRFDFDRSLETIADESLDCAPSSIACVATLVDRGDRATPDAHGRRIPLRITQSADRASIVLEPLAVLPRGHRFSLELRRDLLVVRNSANASPQAFLYPGYAPATFSFATRSLSGREIGAVGPGGTAHSLGDTNFARDIARIGNLLLAGSSTGQILAFDTSDIVRQTPSGPFARANLSASDVRSLATDGHGRVFFTSLLGSSWTVRALTIENVRRASTTSCPSGGSPSWAAGVPCFVPVPGGTKVAVALGSDSSLTGSEYLSLSGGLPAGVPSDLDTLVTDETNPPSPIRPAAGTDSPPDLDVRSFYARYGTGTALPEAEPDGSYILDLTLEATHLRRPEVAVRDARSVCTGEKPWDHFQRVTIDNLSTGQSFYFDIHNEWDNDSSHDPIPGSPGVLRVGRSDGVRVRLSDRLRVRFNLRTHGYVAVVGGGISVVDLNRSYRTPSVEGTQMGASQCGRLLVREEGSSVPFSSCPDGSSTPPPASIARTSAVAVLPAGDDSAFVYSPLVQFGAVHSEHSPLGHPTPPGSPESPSFQVLEALCLRPPASAFFGASVTFRDVAIARDVSWIDENRRYDGSWIFRDAAGSQAGGAEVRSDLAFLSAGSAGVLGFALESGALGRPVGRFYRKDHPVTRLAVDPEARFLFAGGFTAGSPSEPFIDVWDLARVNGVPDPAGADGFDPRLVASLRAPWDANHLLFDETGTGLFYTWGTDGFGGRAVPFRDPQFVFAGLYRPGEDPKSGENLVPVARVTTRFAPLGVPLRVTAADEADGEKKKEIDRVATAAFRVRVSLPGNLAPSGELLAKVQALRSLPEARNIGKDTVGAAVAPPGGPGWPENEVFVTLRRLGGEHATSDTDAAGGSGRLSVLYNEYESREVVLLLADPRARKGYTRQQFTDPVREGMDEESQCRRCERPAHVTSLVDSGALAAADVKELLAGGPWVRVLLSAAPLDPAANPLPEAPRVATENLLQYFSTLNATNDVYRLPSGTVQLFGWADEVPSPTQAALGEPALNAAEIPLEAGGSVLPASGEAKLVTTDHVVKGRGLGFAAERSWRSGLLGYGPLGSAGFSSTLFAHLREIPALPRPRKEGDDGGTLDLLYPGEVQYHDGEGRVFRFYPPCSEEPCPPGYVGPPVPSSPLEPPFTATRCPADYVADDNGSYCAPKGLYLRLEKRGVGWRLVSSQHDSAEFDEHGRLVVLSDRHRKGAKDPATQGNSLQLSYDGFGQLKEAEDDYGRRYRFSYLEDPGSTGDAKRYGLLARLEDFARRTVEYEFHAEDRTLLKVRLPEFTNPHGVSYTGEGRPTVEYVYAGAPFGPGAPLNGADFARRLLTGFRAPHEPGRTEVPERLSFAFDPSTGRVKEASVPESRPGARPKWLFGYEPGAGSQPDRITLTQPWGHPLVHELREGRITAVEEDVEFISDGDATPGPDSVPAPRKLRTEMSFEADGRLESTKRPDGSVIVNEHDSANPDRLARANVMFVTEKAGTAPKGRAAYDETATGYYYADAVHSDNVPIRVTDARQRITHLRVPAASAVDVESGYEAKTDEKQPTPIRGSTDYDPFGRAKAYTGGPGMPKPFSAGALFGKDARGRDGAGFAQEISQGEIKETYEYDGGDKKAFRGNVTKRTTSFGTFSRAEFDEWDRVIEETVGLSTGKPFAPVEDARTRRVYDAAGRLVSETRRQSGQTVETRFVYDDRDQIVSSTATHRASEVPGAEPNVEAVTRHVYDAFGRLESVTSPAGVTTIYGYDGAGRVATERTGASGARRRIHDPNGRVAVVTDGDLGVFRVRYDAWGRTWAEEHPSGAFVERRFDKAGGLLKESTFDKADEATRKLLAETETNVTSYGAVNEVVELLTATPRTQRITRKAHDEAGRLARVTSGPNDSIQRTDLRVAYDEAGRPVDIVDAAGNRTHHVYESVAPWPDRTERFETVPGLPQPVLTTTSSYSRDALGRVVEEARSDGKAVRTTFDQAGNVLSSQVGLEAPTRSSYDGAGRVLMVERPSGRGSTRYGYDADGRLRIRLSDGHERSDRSEYLYEPSTGRLERIEHPDGSNQGFIYNLDDTVDVWTKRSGIQVRHVYDAANRLLGRRIARIGGAGSPVTDGGDTLEWDPLSRLVSSERPDSTAPGVVFPAYDSAGRPMSEIVGPRAPLTRTWDTWSREAAVGLPLGTGADAEGQGYTRSFDDLDRATSVTGATPSLGASFSWGGTTRFYGQATNSPLHVAHRYSFLGSGLGPQPQGTVTTPWRLGVVSVGAAATETTVTDAPSHLWGQLAYGYRPQSGLRVGREVLAGPALLAGQGWSWDLDAAQRLSRAEPGKGSREDRGGRSPALFEVGYGPGDEIRTLTRLDVGETTKQVVGVAGRVLFRNDLPFAYDAEGHRTADDRFEYVWGWRDELLSVAVKQCWPSTATDLTSEASGECPAGQVRPLHAGQQARFVYDALGRVTFERRLGPPSVPGEDASRPFIEEKELLWDGATLLAEVGRSADGVLLWRKSYVPGPAGLDDAVQLRVEKYDIAGSRVSDRLFAYVRDDQGSVLAVVEETGPGDPARPQVVIRYHYDPWGQAHAETGPEVRAALFEPGETSIGSTGQTVDPIAAVPGRLRVDLSLPVDEATLATGFLVERRLTDGLWGALTAAELAMGRDPAAPESTLVLPLGGWQKGATYRVRLTSALRDPFGRPPASPPVLEIPIPSDGTPVDFRRAFPVSFDSFLAAGETAGGAFPGGQALLWQGGWTSSLGGHQLKRARVYDPRTASFLSEDPLDDIDSPNLYGYVAGRPHEATDPWGLCAFGLPCPEPLQGAYNWAKGFLGRGVEQAAGTVEFLDKAATSQGRDEIIARAVSGALPVMDEALTGTRPSDMLSRGAKKIASDAVGLGFEAGERFLNSDTAGQQQQIGSLSMDVFLYLAPSARGFGLGGSPKTAGVRPYEYGLFEDLKARELKFDGLDVDHQPSRAALLKRAEQAKGAPLTPAEAQDVVNKGPSVAVPAPKHRGASPTYLGRNSRDRIAADAANPALAAARDADAMVAAADREHRAAAKRAAKWIKAQQK